MKTKIYALESLSRSAVLSFVKRALTELLILFKKKVGDIRKRNEINLFLVCKALDKHRCKSVQVLNLRSICV